MIYNRKYIKILAGILFLLIAGTALAATFPLDQICMIIETHGVEPVNSAILRQLSLEEIGGYINDPYFKYFSPAEMKRYVESHQGYYGGIGTQITIHEGRVMIWTVYRDTPASAAGLRWRDEILAIDGKPVSGLPLEEIAAMLRGEPGSRVTLTLQRDGVTFNITLTRVIIQSNPVLGHMRDGVAVIEIFNFNAAAPQAFRTVLTELRHLLPRGYVIDLRGNPGGALSSVLEVAREIIPNGPIVRLRSQQGRETVLVSPNHPSPFPMLIVLIDENTASAAEILAAAVQDREAGLVVGRKSYGKGTVQSIFRLRDDGGLRLTTSKYFTPSGRPIDRIGVIPDIEIYDRGAQLNFAVSMIRNISPNMIIFPLDRKKVWVRGFTVEAEQAAFLLEGRTYVPLRIYAELMGFTVSWDHASFTASLEKNGLVIELPVGDSNGYKNGVAFPLNGRTIIRHDRTFVPVRAITEATGARVYWDGPSRQATITW